MSKKPLYDDPVVAEIHAVRARMLAECGGDIKRLMRCIRERQVASGRTVRPAPESEVAIASGRADSRLNDPATEDR